MTRKSRQYKHDRCDQLTLVSGRELSFISNIFTHPKRVWCDHCKKKSPIHEYVWADTGERITDYYQRYASRFNVVDHFLGDVGFYMLVTFGGMFVGGIAGFVLGTLWTPWVAFTLAMIGASVFWLVAHAIGAAITFRTRKRVIGVEEYVDLE